VQASRGFVLFCTGLALFAGVVAEAATRTVRVRCDRGQSINQALEVMERYSGDLLILVRGTCHEDVVIERNDVTLRGEVPGARVVASSSTAIFLDRVSRVSIENLRVQGGTEGAEDMGGAGVFVWQSTAVSVSDLVVERGQSKGMTVVGSTVTITDSVFRYNNGYGLQGNASSLVFLGNEVGFFANKYEGLLLSFQSDLISLANVRASGNRSHGIQVELNSSATLVGSVVVTGNVLAGIKVEHGSVFAGSDVEASSNENGMMAVTGGQIHVETANVHDNTLTGLSATAGGFFEFFGTVNSNGTDGVYLHGSSATFHDVTIQGNTSSDVVLLFGSRVDFEGDNTVDEVECDDTVLVEGDVSCP